MKSDVSLATDLQERLTNHPFTKGMEAHHICVLSESAKLVRFDAGEMIFRTGGPAHGFYLLESGAVAIEATKHCESPVVPIRCMKVNHSAGHGSLNHTCGSSVRARSNQRPQYFFRENTYGSP